LDFSPVESLDRSIRYQEAHHLPLLKTLRIVFIAEIEYFAKIRFLMGNDLETSEVLYFTSFCIKSKEHFF